MFRRLWDKETVVLDLMFGTAPSTLQKAGGKRARRQSDYNNFFIEIVPVPPTRFRPASIMGDKQFEHPQNTHLTNILKTNIRLLEVIKPQQRASAPQVFDLSRAVQTVTQLQVDVNCLIDSTQNKDAAQALPAGIKQVLEKKEGLFRKHMMVKKKKKISLNFYVRPTCRASVSTMPPVRSFLPTPTSRPARSVFPWSLQRSSPTPSPSPSTTSNCCARL